MNAVWLSWDAHRRSIEMSRRLGIPFQLIERSKLPVVGIAFNILKTCRALMGISRKLIVVQNPSLVLTTLACLLKEVKSIHVAQDLHSYFSLHLDKPRGLRAHIYRFLIRFCIRRCDLTIVTNIELKTRIDQLGGHGVVLQDAIPKVASNGSSGANGRTKIVYVCTYSQDEPVDHVIRAGAQMQQDAEIYITGKIPKTLKKVDLPKGVHMTGFLPDSDYFELIASSDAVMALTTREHTLLCGAYEGLAYKKPLILSDKSALKQYFGDRMIYVRNEHDSIANGIQALANNKSQYSQEAKNLAHDLEKRWQGRFEDIGKILEGLSA